MKNHFTEEQRQVLAIDRHIAVTANAGSGKTRMLVERYIDILLSDQSHDPKKILAITFTEKAASEMIDRVVQKVDTMLSDAQNNEEMLILRRLRQKLNSANISTIHSFCVNILRDYCIEADLSPNFTTINEVQSHIMLNEAVDNAINEYLLTDSDSLYDGFDAKDFLFTKHKHRQIVECVKALINKAANYENMVAIYKNENDFCMQIFEEFINETNPIIADFIKNISNAIEVIPDLRAKKKKADLDDFNQRIDAFKDCFGALSSKYSTIEALNGDDKINCWDEIFELCATICKLKINGTHFAIFKLLEKLDEGNVFAINYFGQKNKFKAKEYREYLYEKIFTINISLDNIKLQSRLSKEVIKIVDLVKHNTDEIKKQLNAIDFEDMLILTRNLLRNKEIAFNISNNFTHILVDEFQDTNSVQYDIVKSLVPTFSRENTNISFSPKLFIVGDNKQSIYRFRNAKVAIFNQMKDEIKLINDRDLKKPEKTKLHTKNENILINSEEIGLGDMKLSATFRLKPVIAAFVNKICSKNFENHENIFNIKYNDLIVGRNKDELNEYFENQVNNIVELDESFGNVTFLFDIIEKENVANNSENESTDNEDEASGEGSLLAKYINNLVHNNSNANIKYSDIAILYRNRKALPALQIELIKANIPFSVVKGLGFFQAQEICDLISYLRFLYNPDDDLALIGVLLSPFFSLNNADIMNISAEEGKSLWEKLIFFNEKYSNEKIANEQIKFANKELDNILKIAPIVSFPHLIRSVLSSGNWMSVIINNPAEKQITENIEKFIALARSYQNKDFASIADFLNELDVLQEISNDGEASVVIGENAVSLMTIHAAKGMEFPVVALYGLNNIQAPVKLPLVSEKYGLIFNIASQNNTKNKPNDLLPTMAKKNEENEETAELMRLLYVAITRAKDQLILSATLKKGSSGKLNKIHSCLQFFFDGLEYDAVKIENIVNKVSFKEPISEELYLDLKILDSKNIKKIKTTIHINPPTNSKDARTEPVDENKFTIIVSENIASTEEGRIFSFSEINSFKKMRDADSQYKHDFIKKMLGFDKLNLDLNNERKQLIKKNTKLSAADNGLIYHDLFQNIKHWINDDNQLMLVIENTNCKHQANLDDDEKILIKEVCRTILQTKLLKNRAVELINSNLECNLTMPIAENFITGTIDCIVKNEDGEMEIWDWKTNKFNSNTSEEFEKTSNNYALQMKIYILFLMYLHPNQNKYIARLLFTEKAEVDAEDHIWTTEFSFLSEDKEAIKDEIISQINKITFKL